MTSDTSSNSLSAFSDSSADGNGDIGFPSPHLSQDSRKMLDLVNTMHNLGASMDIDLPLIAVVGSQSAGKSSLIEGISGITLPRAAGTCTRCPTECRLSHSANKWKCDVFICTYPNGNLKREQFGPVITLKSDVEERVRRAQWAALSPDALQAHGVDYFLTNDRSGGTERTFSHDFVSLRISGPDVADLSFVDLPGLVANVGQDGNPEDIELVKRLVSSFIKRPSCIILLTVTCETDFQNQGAQELAKKYDPQGKRTIGVLTKPDRIEQGDESFWISLIRNEKEPLDNGWYCVKQPSTQDINEGITWAQARRKEGEYFETTTIWQELDPMYKRNLRTENLVERLSSVLSKLIAKRLPEIQREIERIIEATQEALKGLPKPPSSDPRNEISNLLHTFVVDLAKHVQGVPDQGILQGIRPDQESFRRSIRVTSPEFQPFYRRQNKHLQPAPFLLDEEGDSSEDDSSDTESELVIGESAPMDRASNPPTPEQLYPSERYIYIDEVMKRAEQARTRELPGNYPYVVQEGYIASFVEQWHEPAKTLCQIVYRKFGDYVQRLVGKHFASFGQGQLKQRVWSLVREHLAECMRQTEERILWIFQLEKGPFTLNTHYYSDYRDKFLSLYHSERQKVRNPRLAAAEEEYSTYLTSTPTGIGKILAGLSEVGVHGVEPEDIVNIIKKDGTEPALFIMANVRAYFQVAYKRFVDNVPRAIDYELIQGAERNILQKLYSGLGIHGSDGERICREFAEEDPDISVSRKGLLNKLDRMNAARKELEQIGWRAN